MKEICMFGAKNPFAVICSETNISFDTFPTFAEAQKKAAWMSSYHGRRFEVAKVVSLVIAEHA